MTSNFPLILIRGGGDLATGVAARLHRCGFGVIATEVAKPKTVRRLVAMAEAVFSGQAQVEDLSCTKVENPTQALQVLDKGHIPVVVDPKAATRYQLHPIALVDARMLKRKPEVGKDAAPFVVGLGPGFIANENCHAVVETKRGHHLGRVIWDGSAERDTGIPESVAGHSVDRVLRAPAGGSVVPIAELGSMLKKDEMIAKMNDTPLTAPFDGALRGLIHESVRVEPGEKIGDLDPRGEPKHCFEISDKALAIGGGVMEALLSRPEIRGLLGS